MMKSAIAALIASSASACANEWMWEQCSQSWWRDACEGENVMFDAEDCGYVYWDDWDLEEYWVTCAEFDGWWWCEEE